MNRRTLCIALLAFLPFTYLHATELTLELGNDNLRLSSAQLLAHPQAQSVEISDEVFSSTHAGNSTSKPIKHFNPSLHVIW